jgi:hypothetical protein
MKCSPEIAHGSAGSLSPFGERVGVRGFVTLVFCDPSPDAPRRVDLSLWER